jgi:hypothetical protein
MSSELLDKLTEEAKALPEQEKRILASRLLEGARPASEEQRENADGPSVDVRYRKREYQWMKEHRDEYPGEHLALEGDKLIAHGKNLRQVMDEADKAGAMEPLFVYVESPDELPFGGW